MNTVAAETTAPKPFKVLVIEDDTLTRLALCRALQRLDCVAIGACNGFMGVQQFRREAPDLIITDIHMPDKGGLSAILEIRAASPQANIVAISSGDVGRCEDVLRRAKEAGAAYALRKPLAEADVRNLLKTVFVSQGRE